MAARWRCVAAGTEPLAAAGEGRAAVADLVGARPEGRVAAVAVGEGVLVVAGRRQVAVAVDRTRRVAEVEVADLALGLRVVAAAVDRTTRAQS